MKIKISYFANMRNFNKTIIPISTAMWDPKWYHKPDSPTYRDKNGVLVGLRFDALSPKGIDCACPCENAKSRVDECKFLRDYRDKIFKIDFNDFKSHLMKLATSYANNEGIDIDDITIALMVYEVPSNPCSERSVIRDWLQSNGEDGSEI